MAKQALDEAMAIDSIHPYVINRLAGWFTDLGGEVNQEKAVAMFEKYRASDGPLYPCWFNDYSIVLTERGRYAESEALLMEAIAIDSMYPSLWGNLRRLYLLTNRDAEAETVLKKAVALDSTYANIWNLLGSVYLQNHRYAEAEPIFWRLVTWNANHLAGWNNLGSIFRETNRYDESEKMYRKAFEIDADFLPTYRNYAKLKAKTGDLQAAFSCLEQAIQKGYNDYQGMQTDPAFAPLRAQKEQWGALMKKHFPDQIKD